MDGVAIVVHKDRASNRGGFNVWRIVQIVDCTGFVEQRFDACHVFRIDLTRLCIATKVCRKIELKGRAVGLVGDNLATRRVIHDDKVSNMRGRLVKIDGDFIAQCVSVRIKAIIVIFDQ